jgi:hypothetical protein
MGACAGPDPRARRHQGRVCLAAGRPLVGPSDHREGELTLSRRRDHQPAPQVRGIRLRVTRGTERHQAVEVEVRAAASALDGMVDLQPSADTARLADPLGAGQDLRADLAPGLEGRRRATERQRPTRPDTAARGLPHTDPGAESSATPHAG